VLLLERLDTVDRRANGGGGAIFRGDIRSGLEGVSCILRAGGTAFDIWPGRSLVDRGVECGGLRECDKGSQVDDLESDVGSAKGATDLFEVDMVGTKSSKDTVCGPLEVNVFPCRCLGGGGFILVVFPLTAGSEFDRPFSWLERSYDERGVSIGFSRIVS
jgi:hypothetical protein